MLTTSGWCVVTFPAKTTLTMTLILIGVYGAYFTVVLGPVASSPNREAEFTGLVIGAGIVQVVLAVVTHVVLALVYRAEVTAGRDERDRLVALRGAQFGGYVLAVGVFVGILLAMMQFPTFWIAQSLIATLVLGEIIAGAAKLVLYRQEREPSQVVRW